MLLAVQATTVGPALPGRYQLSVDGGVWIVGS